MKATACTERAPTCTAHDASAYRHMIVLRAAASILGTKMPSPYSPQVSSCSPLLLRLLRVVSRRAAAVAAAAAVLWNLHAEGLGGAHAQQRHQQHAQLPVLLQLAEGLAKGHPQLLRCISSCSRMHIVTGLSGGRCTEQTGSCACCACCSKACQCIHTSHPSPRPCGPAHSTNELAAVCCDSQHSSGMLQPLQPS